MVYFKLICMINLFILLTIDICKNVNECLSYKLNRSKKQLKWSFVVIIKRSKEILLSVKHPPKSGLVSKHIKQFVFITFYDVKQVSLIKLIEYGYKKNIRLPISISIEHFI